MRAITSPIEASGQAFPTVISLLERSSWYPLLSASAQERVVDEMRMQDLPAGATLSRRGETPQHWYGVMGGLLKWSVTGGDGRSITFGGLTPGSWFGEGTLLRGAPRAADLVALQSSVVALMPNETFLWLYGADFAFNHFLVQQINERLHWFMDGWAVERLLNVDGKVARALASLFHPWLYPSDHSHLQVSQEEIASLAGISRPRCNRALKKLQVAGLVKLEYGGLTVLDLEGLRRAAAF